MNKWVLLFIAAFGLVVSSAQTSNWQEDFASVDAKVLKKIIGCTAEDVAPVTQLVSGYFTQTLQREMAVFSACKQSYGLNILQLGAKPRVIWRSITSNHDYSNEFNGPLECGKVARGAKARDLLLCHFSRSWTEGANQEFSVFDFANALFPSETLLLTLPDTIWDFRYCNQYGIHSVFSAVAVRTNQIRLTFKSSHGLSQQSPSECEVFGHPSNFPRVDSLEFTWQNERGFVLTAPSQKLAIDLGDRIQANDALRNFTNTVKRRVPSPFEIAQLSRSFRCVDASEQPLVRVVASGLFTGSPSPEALLDVYCTNSSKPRKLVRLTRGTWRVIQTVPLLSDLIADAFNCFPIRAGHLKRDVVICSKPENSWAVFDYRNAGRPRIAMEFSVNSAKWLACNKPKMSITRVETNAGILRFHLNQTLYSNPTCNLGGAYRMDFLEFRWNDARGFRAMPETAALLKSLPIALKFSGQ